MITFTCRTSSAETLTSDCLVIPYFAHKSLPPHLKDIDQQLDGQLIQLKRQGDLPTALGQCRLLFTSQQKFKRLLLICLGKTQKLTITDAQRALTSAWQQLSQTGAKKWTLSLNDALLFNADIPHQIRFVAENWLQQSYQYPFKKTATKHTLPKQIIFTNIPKNALTHCQQQLHYAQHIGQAVNQARALSDLPPNTCTPTYLAEQAERFADQHPTSVDAEILCEQEMVELGMGALLSIGQGSAEPSQFIILRYQGHTDSNERPYVFVGKGVTFDTGGINLKSRPGMRDMKMDMCGAASVFSAFCSAVELKLPINLVTLIASVENMPSSQAVKVSDVVTSLSGKTIEILNTDAEGRVILSDALTYSERFNPKTVIDVATLTGAIAVALGHYRTGLYSNHTPLTKALVKAGDTSHDLVWPMPLDAVYQQHLKSNVADLKNISDTPQPGSIIGATFLSAFTEKLKWAHLDMGGSALKSHQATGRCVALLVQYLLNEAAQK